MKMAGQKGEKDFPGRKNASGITMDERPQPHNADAERAILASMILEPSPCIDHAMEKLGSSGEVFYLPVHKIIYDCLSKMHAEDLGIDIISLSNRLERQGRLDDVGGEIFLTELCGSIASTANIEAWCSIVRDFYILRGMINVCAESMMKCYNDDSEIDSLVDEIEGDIFNVRYKHIKPNIVDLRDQIEETFINIEKIIRKEVEVGIPTGYPDLDNLVIGLKPGEMFVLAARPSIGKTSIALNIIRNIALREQVRPIAFFSLEMTAEQITRRLLCTEAQIPESTFFDGSFKHNEMSKLTNSVTKFKRSKIFIDPTGGLTIAELRAKARRLMAMEKIELIVIDYLQLMKVGGKVDSRQQEVAEISGGIKKLAKELNVPVLVLAQLNREIEKGTGPKSAKPKLSHLRESGAIEQDADLVVFLHRDRDETKENKDVMTEGSDAQLIVEKNRNGRTGYVDLKFFPNIMEFRSKSRYSEADRPKPID